MDARISEAYGLEVMDDCLSADIVNCTKVGDMDADIRADMRRQMAKATGCHRRSSQFPHGLVALDATGTLLNFTGTSTLVLSCFIKDLLQDLEFKQTHVGIHQHTLFLHVFAGLCVVLLERFRMSCYAKSSALSQVQSDMMLEMNKRLEDMVAR